MKGVSWGCDMVSYTKTRAHETQSKETVFPVRMLKIVALDHTNNDLGTGVCITDATRTL